MKWALILVLIFKAVSVLTLSLRLRNHPHKHLHQIALLAFVLVVAHIANLFTWSAHSLLGHTIAVPGSPITRGLIFQSSAFLRRAIEPSLILLILCEIFYIRIVVDQKLKSLLVYSAILLAFSIFFECLILANPVFYNLYPAIIMFLKTLKTICLIVSIILSSSTLMKESTYRASSLSSKSWSQLSNALILSFLILTSTICITNLIGSSKLKLAIHYYVWFPENWKANYGNPNHKLKMLPRLGEYKSDDPLLIKNHVKQLDDRNIEIVFLDWWPNQRSLRNRAKVFVKYLDPSKTNLKFALHFETLSFTKNKTTLELNKKTIKKLEHYFTFLATEFFDHPNYLSINGKKVVNLYTTRHILGDLSGALNQIKNAVKEKTGHELYLIGDEVFYNVISGSNTKNKYLQKKYIPDWDRISALDAITLYNPFDPTFNYGDSPGEIQTNFIARTRELYDSYRAIAETAGVPFIPTVIPSYNDTAIRPKENHLIIERVINETNTYTELSKAALDILPSSNSKLITITSWNEWNEGTNIEP